MSICATRANFQPQNLAEMIHICLIFDTILRKHLTISTTLALLNQHDVSEFRPIVNNGDWKHVEGMHQEEEEGKRPNVP